jgi:hypothetical protein
LPVYLCMPAEKTATNQSPSAFASSYLTNSRIAASSP